MPEDQYIEIGRISGTFGVGGLLKVQFDIIIPENKITEKGFTDVEAFYFKLNNQFIPYFIEYLVDPLSDKPKIKLEGIESKEAATGWIGRTFYLPENQIKIETEPQPYQDITGFTVIVDKNRALGRIDDIYQLPQQSFAGLKYGGKEVLIPLNEDFILKIDRQGKMIFMELPEGILDL
jgi:16S rRNA processing protein RimM